MKTLVHKALLSSEIGISDGNRGLSRSGESGPFRRRTDLLQLVLNWPFPPCFCSQLREIPKTEDKNGKKQHTTFFQLKGPWRSDPQPSLPSPR